MRSFLASAHKDHYIIVAGPKGVGKTCVVDTATEAMFGVVSVEVAPGKHYDAILANVFTAITRSNLDLSASTKRVLRWHRLIFRKPAIVVLRASERDPPLAFAAMHSAARALTQDFGLRVVIDASDNSLPENAKKTKREETIEVGPMSRSVLESVPDLAELLSALKAADLADVVWECVGGVPADYIQLVGKWEKAGRGLGSNLEAVVEPFLMKLLDQAISERDVNVVANPGLKEFYARFCDEREIPFSDLQDKKLVRPSPDKVLRLKRTPISALVPADAATAVVLRLALRKAPKLQELKEKLLHNTPPPKSSTANV